MSKGLIFIVEDEVHIQQLVKYNLETEGYRVEGFSDGESMLAECRHKTPDLFILDVMLPGIDGLEICKYLHQASSNTKDIPIIMLTAKSDEFDKVLGLELGADDYIVKPFSTKELIARVKVVLRRTNQLHAIETELLKYGDILVDCAARKVFKRRKPVELTYKEFELLKYLMINKGKVLSRDLILDKIWGFEFIGETRTVDVHIRYLRQKIEDDDNNPCYIETVRGIGYRFNDNSSEQDMIKSLHA